MFWSGLGFGLGCGSAGEGEGGEDEEEEEEEEESTPRLVSKLLKSISNNRSGSTFPSATSLSMLEPSSLLLMTGSKALGTSPEMRNFLSRLARRASLLISAGAVPSAASEVVVGAAEESVVS